MDFLFPERRNLRKVGGRGEKDYWVFGENYNWHWSPEDAVEGPVTDFDPVPFGEWRVELEPADSALDHTFLTVMRPSTAPMTSRLEVSAVDSDDMEGALIRGSREDLLALFSREVRGLPAEASIELELPIELGARPLHFFAIAAKSGWI